MSFGVLAGFFGSVAALVAVVTAVSIMRGVLAGRTTPLPTQELIAKQDKHIALLEEQNTALRQERAFDRKELLDLVRSTRDALVEANLFLTRYESLGGMVKASRLRQELPEE